MLRKRPVATDANFAFAPARCIVRGGRVGGARDVRFPDLAAAARTFGESWRPPLRTAAAALERAAVVFRFCFCCTTRGCVDLAVGLTFAFAFAVLPTVCTTAFAGATDDRISPSPRPTFRKSPAAPLFRSSKSNAFDFVPVSQTHPGDVLSASLPASLRNEHDVPFKYVFDRTRFVTTHGPSLPSPVIFRNTRPFPFERERTEIDLKPAAVGTYVHGPAVVVAVEMAGAVEAFIFVCGFDDFDLPPLLLLLFFVAAAAAAFFSFFFPPMFAFVSHAAKMFCTSRIFRSFAEGAGRPPHSPCAFITNHHPTRFWYDLRNCCTTSPSTTLISPGFRATIVCEMRQSTTRALSRFHGHPPLLPPLPSSSSGDDVARLRDAKSCFNRFFEARRLWAVVDAIPEIAVDDDVGLELQLREHVGQSVAI